MSGTGLRWGIAGYGDIVRRRALPALLALGETVTRVWGRNPDRARALCAEYGVARGTGDYAELLDAVDVVYVATPVAAHLPLAARALRAGLPVLVEKPLGLVTQVADRETVLRGGAGTPVGVAYYRRLAPALARVRELVEGRAVHAVEVAFRFAFDPAPGDPRHWRTDVTVAGGGVLADAGSHRLDLLVWLLGTPARVTALLGRCFPLGAERVARVGLAWPSGTRAELDLEWADGGPYDRLSLTFDGGRLVLDPLDSGRIRGVVDGIPIEEHLPPHENPHAPLLADFAASVRNGTAPVCPAAEGAIVDDLIMKAYTTPESTEENR